MKCRIFLRISSSIPWTTILSLVAGRLFPFLSLLLTSTALCWLPSLSRCQFSHFVKGKKHSFNYFNVFSVNFLEREKYFFLLMGKIRILEHCVERNWLNTPVTKNPPMSGDHTVPWSDWRGLWTLRPACACEPGAGRGRSVGWGRAVPGTGEGRAGVHV